MFIRLSTLFFYVVALLGVATAVPTSDLEVRKNNRCNTGSINCCNNVQSSDSSLILELFGLLSLPMPTPGSQVGFTCSPTTISGLGSGSSCTSQPVCCKGNHFSGLIVVGCSPITINL